MSRTAVQNAQTPEPAASGAPLVVLGTKAETLARLRPVLRHSRVLDQYAFPLSRWSAEPEAVLAGIRERLGGRALVVRSSARAEDGATASLAGAFTSCLGVNGSLPENVAAAINRVIASYGNGQPDDQVLVQPMLARTVLSGVVMTRDLGDGSPYFVINYDDESGRTDTITGGGAVNKTVFVFRGAQDDHVESPRIASVLRMARELEAVCGGIPLDIEFSLDEAERVHLLQARPISVSGGWRRGIAEDVAAHLPVVELFLTERSRPRPTVLGRRTILGVMPDWNPAEILGTTPGALATSLYRELITKSVWREARAAMGYRQVPAEELMVVLAGRPYIDVRNSFNSLLPASLSQPTGARVVDAWLDRLEANPELHDKVEFDVAQTCLDLTFDEVLAERYGRELDPRGEFRGALLDLTRSALDLGAGGSLTRAESRVALLAQWQAQRARPWKSPAAPHAIAGAAALLEECRDYGTRPFAVLARHAFIAESLLRSAVEIGALAPERLAAWRRSVRTVSGDFLEERRALQRGDLTVESFLARFGHLRPGTYDIQSLSYADRPEIFAQSLPETRWETDGEWALHPRERHALERALASRGLGGIGADGLLEYARRAIAGREYAKFVFTRNLSDALELIARWGESLDLDREALSHLSWTDLSDGLAISLHGREREHWTGRSAVGRERLALARAVKLGHLIRDARDLFVVPQHRSLANFLGSAHLHGPVVRVDAYSSGDLPLAGSIVCIENADPGYDWIFGQGIRALITKYGGTNSHMAIRCAEFGLPAAIGCGSQLFDRIVAAGAVDLNCAEKTVRPAHEH